MKFGKRMAILMLGLLLVPAVLYAQQQPIVLRVEQQPSVAKVSSMTHLRVDILLTEYSGDKKISSLPYTMYVGVRDNENQAGKQSLRMGVNVAIAGGIGEHIGTDIDCWTSAEKDGRYRIEGNVDRSSLYSADQSSIGTGGAQLAGDRPVVRSFSSGFDLVLRDGETGEGVSATDPFNGHVLKVNVTIHVAK